MKRAYSTLLFASAAVTTAFGGLPALMSRDEVEKGAGVCLTGVVTCVAYWQQSSCVIASPEDPNGRAIYVTGQYLRRVPTQLPEGGISPGDVPEVKGTVAPMMFAPGVFASSFMRVGRMSLPDAP